MFLLNMMMLLQRSLLFRAKPLQQIRFIVNYPHHKPPTIRSTPVKPIESPANPNPPVDRSVGSVRSTRAAAPQKPHELSNRKKFARIQPPISTFKRIEELGLGALRRINRFAKLKEIVDSEQERLPEPEFTFPHLIFFAGAKVESSFPPESLPEFGFVGRSNVGKSSLINALANSSVVRVSDKPGLTQQINFYTAGEFFHMVDLPGYGFAFVSEEEKKSWRDLMETYIERRGSLIRIFVIIDARHGLMLPDKSFLKMLDSHSVPFQIVLTKCDLLKPPDLARRHLLTTQDAAQYRHAVDDVLMVSSLRGGGVNRMRKKILFLTEHLREDDYYWKIEKEMKEVGRVKGRRGGLDKEMKEVGRVKGRRGGLDKEMKEVGRVKGRGGGMKKGVRMREGKRDRSGRRSSLFHFAIQSIPVLHHNFQNAIEQQGAGYIMWNRPRASGRLPQYVPGFDFKHSRKMAKGFEKSTGQRFKPIMTSSRWRLQRCGFRVMVEVGSWKGSVVGSGIIRVGKTHCEPVTPSE
ncbi:P-loop containing nucleoside triphosphate hydrolase protein [Jimgerdemannia flammicorona]|uniref:P-loop containing nucleoside triphosphate hydrolase protein n=1 Tax=Jimgerdemannia flammicorona TaxID=994334 RepID=A0A433DII8_9FUNG|nr:P-loop containing nucleoside triphosphate hydrolase protein [Jimgerdemannia flammicorona]